jgi:hypothetical protein
MNQFALALPLSMEGLDGRIRQRRDATRAVIRKNSIQLPSDGYVGTCLLGFRGLGTKKPARLAGNTSRPDGPRAILTAHVSILSER